MTHEQMIFQSAVRKKILCGATQLADAVRIMLGPKSKPVRILLLTEAAMTEIPVEKTAAAGVTLDT